MGSAWIVASRCRDRGSRSRDRPRCAVAQHRHAATIGGRRWSVGGSAQVAGPPCAAWGTVCASRKGAVVFV